MEGLIKSLGLIADIEDVSGRTVSSYWSNFGNVDFDKQVTVKGAFKKTISEVSKVKPIWFLKNHNFDLDICQPKELVEDTKGLLSRCEIPDTLLGNDVLKMYKAGFYNQHSYGFVVLQKTAENGIEYIKEVKLFEGSVVPFGANPETPMVSITKGLKLHYDTVPNAVQRDYEITKKLLNTWDGSENGFLEIQIKAIALESFIKDSEATKQEPIEAKSIRERIELKGLSWDSYQKLPEEKQAAMSFLGNVEYQMKAIAGYCGVGLLEKETEQFSNAILPMCKSMNDYIEKAETAVLSGTGIIEEENNSMPEIKSNTDPLKGSQPKEETALEIFIKSLKKSK